MRESYKPIEIDAFCRYRFVNNPVSSPDGRWTAFTVYTVLRQENAYKGALHLLDHRTMKWAPVCPELDIRRYDWTPSGELLAFAGGSAWRIDPETGERRECFPFAHTPENLVFCGPDRALFVGAARRECHANPDVTVIEEIPYLENGTSYLNGAYRRLYLLDLKSGAVTPVSSPEISVSAFTCFDGAAICAGVRNAFEEARPVVYAYDPASGSARTLVPEGAYYIHFLEDLGGRLVFSGTTGAEYGKNQYGGFYEIDPKTGDVSLLCRHEASMGENEIIGDCGYGAGRKRLVSREGLYFTSVIGTHSEIFLLRADGSLRSVFASQSSIDGFSLAGENGDLLVTALLTETRPQELYLSQLDHAGHPDHIASPESADHPGPTVVFPCPRWAAPAMVTDFNAGITQCAVAPLTALRFEASDGRTLDGWIMTPPDLDETRSYPGILYIHGGPRMIYSTMFYHEMQVLAARGYIVFFCNPVGSSGRGNEFGYLQGKAGVEDYRELMEFTDYCLEQCPRLDPGRLAVMGGSYGGYMVNWIIGHTDRFKAAVSQRSISNWMTTEAGSDIGYYYVKEQLGAGMLEDPQLLWDRSPVKYAGSAVTPTLFLHSDRDFRCWIAEPMQMFYALKKRGVPTRMTVFHGENHTLAKLGKPENRIARLEEILNWLAQYCAADQTGAPKGVSQEMRHIEVVPENICAKKITFDLEGNIVHNVSFESGCDGNLKAIGKVAEGKTVEELEGYFLGNTCKAKGTSCTDQMVRAMRRALETQQA